MNGTYCANSDYNEIKGQTSIPKSLPKAVYEPTSLDICFGRSKGNFQHQGNVAFRQIVQSNLQRYTSSDTKDEKSKVIESVLNELRGKGYRCIKEDATSGKWNNIGDEGFREKVSDGLRKAAQTNKSKKRKTPGIAFQGDLGVLDLAKSSPNHEKSSSSRNDSGSLFAEGASPLFSPGSNNKGAPPTKHQKPRKSAIQFLADIATLEEGFANSTPGGGGTKFLTNPLDILDDESSTASERSNNFCEEIPPATKKQCSREESGAVSRNCPEFESLLQEIF